MHDVARFLVSFATAWGLALVMMIAADARAGENQPPLTITWAKNYLTIKGARLPGGQIEIHYLEAYCRPGSTDRDWGKTVIGHRAELLSASDDRRLIKLRDTLADGVVVTHTITAGEDEIDFRLSATNPTESPSDVAWAQPCIRVDKFTGCNRDDARALVPKYVRQSFIFLDGRLSRLPTEPWADKARYTPGQVYRPAHVDPDDVNPRPLSKLVPSNGLIGCYSADGREIMAVAWEPYQELFQGVITCLHSDFRIGGLAPGETKQIRGKIYLVGSDVAGLLERYEEEFPEHAASK